MKREKIIELYCSNEITAKQAILLANLSNLNILADIILIIEP